MEQAFTADQIQEGVEFELKDTSLFECANCKKVFVRLKAYLQVLSPLWCTQCVKLRTELPEVGVYFGQDVGSEPR